jgi:isochorismate synthase
MAIGTQKSDGLDEVIWQKKEMEEQQFVTDFILNNLKI